MNLFKFQIYDIHEVQKHNEYGELYTEPFSLDWNKFYFVINTDIIEVTAFRSYVLFDADNNPTQCTKVFLSDGSYVYAVEKLNAFTNLLENIKPLPSNVPLLESKI